MCTERRRVGKPAIWWTDYLVTDLEMCDVRPALHGQLETVRTDCVKLRCMVN